MAPPRRLITKDMLTAAKEKGWNVTQTANHYGMHRSSITAACERFNIVLALSKFNPHMPSTKSRFWKETDAKPKTKAIWSCKPGAIARALKEFENKRPLQARS